MSSGGNQAMNLSNATTQTLTVVSGAFDPTRCNFMYAPAGVWSTCNKDKGHAEPHHDSRTGVSWSNNMTFVVNTTAAANP